MLSTTINYKVTKNKFRDFYKRSTVDNKKSRIHEHINDRIIRLFIKKLSHKLVNNRSGVHIKRIGYFYVHMIPFDTRWYTSKRIHKFHPTFIPTDKSIFTTWSMDFHFSNHITEKIQSRVKEGYRYLNMINGVTTVDYFYLGNDKSLYENLKSQRNDI